MKKIACILVSCITCVAMPHKVPAQDIKGDLIFVITVDLIGVDFATFTNSTTLKLDVRLVLQTEDSATIYCTYTGFLNADEETYKLNSQGSFI